MKSILEKTNEERAARNGETVGNPAEIHRQASNAYRATLTAAGLDPRTPALGTVFGEDLEMEPQKYPLALYKADGESCLATSDDDLKSKLSQGWMLHGDANSAESAPESRRKSKKDKE
jgi:hypothetical protein